MKKVILLLSMIALATSLKGQDEDGRFKLYPTQNIWTFLKLDTSDGRVWQVQYSTDGDSYRFESPLCIEPLVLDSDRPIGRYSLSSTENIYNFVLLDKEFGTTYQVQWHSDVKNRIRKPISEDEDLIWSQGYTAKRVGNKYVYIDMNSQYFNDEYYEYASAFSDNGIALVRLQGKYNFLKIDGTYILDEWVDYISSYMDNDGYYIVKLNDMYNYINTSGSYRFSNWYQGISSINNINLHGYFRIMLNDKSNLIDSSENTYFDEWYDNISVNSDHIKVELGDSCNIYLFDKELVFNKWYNDIDYNSQYNGYYRVTQNNKQNYASLSGKLLLNEWVDYVGKWEDGYAIIMQNDKYNIIDTKGTLLMTNGQESLLSMKYFLKGILTKEQNNKIYITNLDGDIISTMGFDSTGDVYDGYIIVQNSNLENVVSIKTGQLICKQWYDSCERASNGFIIVRSKNKYNYVDLQNGKRISNKWYNEVEPFDQYGQAQVWYYGKWRTINNKGKFVD